MEVEIAKAKIKKLLALSQSPNENEAKTALLKARVIMAEYKLTERDCADAEKQSIKRINTEYTFNSRREPWIADLSVVIGENYCCQAVFRRKKGKQTNTVGFIGLADDAEIASTMFSYAVDFVRHEVKQIYLDEQGQFYYSRWARIWADNYTKGFCAGISQMFDKQKAQNQEWGLVLVMPKEVKQAVAGFKEFKKYKERSPYDAKGWSEGFKDGKNFNPNRRLNENKEKPSVVKDLKNKQQKNHMADPSARKEKLQTHEKTH